MAAVEVQPFALSRRTGPFKLDGAKIYPSKEEAVSVSDWAARTGHAKLKLWADSPQWLGSNTA